MSLTTVQKIARDFSGILLLLVTLTVVGAGPATAQAVEGPAFSITATAGANGSITPSGVTSVSPEGSQSYSIVAAQNYHIESVLVDGVSTGLTGAIASYTFSVVLADHTILATFAPTLLTITATAGPGGSISPSGAVARPAGSDVAFSITPSAGYEVNSVTVDAVSVATTTLYTFSHIDNGHTIAVTFRGVYACTDALDNDEDGRTDNADPDCHVGGTLDGPYNPLINSEYTVIVPPLDVCTNIEGIQSTVPEGYTVNEGVCTAPTVVAPPTVTSSGGGGRSGGGSGRVLGTSTQGKVLGASCGLYLEKYLRFGSSKNDTEQVKKLQTFLNKWMKSGLVVNGVYGPETVTAVKSFQATYANDILKPWGISAPTGLVYYTTVHKMNDLECPDGAGVLPKLIDWSRNPKVQ